jgi:hypothetical protein
MDDQLTSSSIAGVGKTEVGELMAGGLGQGSNLFYDGWKLTRFLLTRSWRGGELTWGVLEHGRWRIGMAAVGGFSVWGWAAAAILGGSPVAVAVKMGSTAPSDAPWPVARARAVAKRLDAAKLKLAGDNGEKWEGGHQGWGVQFLRVGFIACAARSPHRFYLQFEARLIFGWDSRKISSWVWVGDKPSTSIFLDSVAAV